ncbi:small ribosomal subunit protein mS40 isoform X1 [Maylandia zebra]|uniref:small ribosomal subunit protein mS40 isoform X1 n=1 Tax=Astatotilapia calliptera TaxID=8154 RepID=UPI000E417753|nr:28S ribosomal protein S18b, mitochondrial isoform X1 [Astatotilapia calliptera]
MLPCCVVPLLLVLWFFYHIDIGPTDIRYLFSRLQRLPARTCLSLSPFIHPRHSYCKAASLQDEAVAQATEALARYKDRPWDYLESEEYIERYGSSPVWADYRRNHKGGIPPQKTRKTCIRGDKICGNPCPICRDPNIIIHHQNVKLLQQFISPHTGMVLDSTRTGVCMKQQKKLNEAVDTAQDHGLLPFQIPYVEFSGEDYSNSHDAVGSTPPPSSLTLGDNWYTWYGEILPDENEVAKVKKTYKAYLK